MLRHLVAEQKLKRHLFKCVLRNLLVALSRNKFPHYVLWAGPGYTHFVPLYWLMVFISKNTENGIYL